MAEIVELASAAAIERAREVRRKSFRPREGYRSVRIATKNRRKSAARALGENVVTATPRENGESEGRVHVHPHAGIDGVDLEENTAPASPSQGCESEGRTQARPRIIGDRSVDLASEPAAAIDEQGLEEKGEWVAEECFRLVEVGEGAVVVFWRLEKIVDGMAVVLAAVCKELLRRVEVKRVVFDFSGVQEVTTEAVGVLARFRNRVEPLGKEMHLVAGPQLREELLAIHVGRAFGLQESVYFLLGREIRFVEERKVRSGVLSRISRKVRKGLLAVVLACSVGAVPGQDAGGQGFPSLRELEGMLVQAPGLRAIRVRLEKQREERRWVNRVSVHANYSQHFSSFLPFVPTPELAVSGGTFLGVSVSVKLGELLGEPGLESFERRLMVIEYERVFQEKLAELRRLYWEREKVLVEIRSLDAAAATAALELEKVRVGMSLAKELDGIAVFDPIDLARAEEKVERIASQRRQAELHVGVLEVGMMAVLGRGH